MPPGGQFIFNKGSFYLKGFPFAVLQGSNSHIMIPLQEVVCVGGGNMLQVKCRKGLLGNIHE